MTAASSPYGERADQLADSLVAFVAEQLDAIARRHAPGGVLPRVFAGHPVGPDTRADLAFTSGLLHEAGVERIADVALEDVVLDTLRGLEGAATHTFYSYRAAESLLRFGGYAGNPRLEKWSDSERANLRLAVDSSGIADGLRKGHFPINYAIVVARCEFARQRLGLLDDSSLLDELCERSRTLLARAEHGWIDDSNEERGQFDIYTADMFLFAEPLAERIGTAWSEGLRRVLGDVDALALPGGAIVWGRSIGALGLAMTIELAALGVGRGLAAEASRWLARAAWALDELRDWYTDGVIRSHQHRSTMFYRGPARRLQMTFDVLGKLVQAALELRAAQAVVVGSPASAWPPVDRYVRFGAPGPNERAGAWAFRDRRQSFVWPLVGGFSSDYLPAPRAPGLYETPVSGPPSMLPVLHRRGKALVAAGVPDSVEHADGTLEARWVGFAEPSAGRDQPPAFAGSRRLRARMTRRTLEVAEEIELEDDLAEIEALALQVPALADRPLDVAFTCETPHRVDRIDVEGLAEYRSFWSEIATIHQLDLDPQPTLRFRWSVTPQLRVRSTAYTHPYDDALYGPLAGRLRNGPAPGHLVDDVLRLYGTDVLHIHWPEWWQGVDPDRHGRAIARLEEAGVRIVWTMHNLRPHHFRGEDGTRIYQMWAEAAHAVIHHTTWGRDRALETYRYREDTVHRVIAHGHWGARAAPHAAVPRRAVEEQLGLSPCAIRLGVIGAPRAEKDVQLVLDAFHACSRDDLQLLVVCLEDERVPDDPRILAIGNRFEQEHVYYQRLNAIDVILLPFREGMMVTGTAFDAIGAGKAAMTSDWPVLDELFGDAAIRYGSTRDQLTACLEALDAERVASSSRGMRALQSSTDWRDSAEATIALMEEVAARD